MTKRKDQTSNLELHNVLAVQAQKPVTHNEAIHALVPIAVFDRHLATPPANGASCIVAAGALELGPASRRTLPASKTAHEGWIADEDVAVA